MHNKIYISMEHSHSQNLYLQSLSIIKVNPTYGFEAIISNTYYNFIKINGIIYFSFDTKLDPSLVNEKTIKKTSQLLLLAIAVPHYRQKLDMLITSK